MLRFAFVPILLLAVTSSGAGAQHMRSPLVRPVATALSSDTAPHAPPRQQVQAAHPGRDRLLMVVGGAVIGAGLGFFASHVALSNWEEGGGSEAARTRAMYAAGGAAMGAIGGFIIGGSRRRPLVPHPKAPTVPDRNVITLDEILQTDAVHALELVQRIRNSWLITRGIDSFREFSRGQAQGRSISVTPGEDRVVVYLDHVRLGGPERLREIPTVAIASLRFYDANAATFKWGGGHTHGAILVTSRSAR